MRTYKEEQRTVKVNEKYFCDKCGKEIPDYGSRSLNNTVHISYVYSDYGDYWVEYEWEIEDLCLDCCIELEKLLTKNGYRINKKEDFL